MLSKEDKERIRAEEIFRHEVRGEIKATRTKGGFMTSLFKFFNSSFGIWFLSAVVLSSTLYIYKDIQNDRAVYAQNRLRIEKIDMEVQERIDGFEAKLKAARTNNNLSTAIRKLSDSKSIHSKFLQYSFTGLVRELIVLVPAEEQKELKQVLTIALKLKKDREKLYKYENAGNADIENTKNELLGYLDKDFNIRGWQE